MTTAVLKRQFIKDATGNPIGVILPLEEFALVENILDSHRPLPYRPDPLTQMAKAVKDPLFMADLHNTMLTFSDIDTEWWESEQ